MRINHNLMAMNTHRMLGINQQGTSKSIEKLSSGFRINRAGDDAAGLAISEKMRGQIRGLDQASRNSQDAISLVQTAEGALNETHDILQRMRELSVQSANDTNVTIDRDAIQNEITQLTSEIDRIGNTTEFNTRKLLNGGASVAASIVDGDSNGESAYISNISGTGDTQVGAVISLATSTLAVAATDASTDAIASGALDGASAMTLNGVSFSYASGTAIADVLDGINNAGIGVTATLDGSDMINITSNNLGSVSEFTVTGTATGNFAGIVSQTGTDAIVTVGNGAEFSNYSAVGNRITIQDGSAKGLSFDVSGVLTDTAGDGTDDTVITVDSNGGLNMQIGANEGQDMYVSIADMRSTALGVNGVDISTSSAASAAITTINDAITSVSTERAKLGAVQNRLEHTIKNLDTSSENLSASESRIRDVDMAKEMMEFTKNNILQQAAQSMLAQANNQPQGILQLLR